MYERETIVNGYDGKTCMSTRKCRLGPKTGDKFNSYKEWNGENKHSVM